MADITAVILTKDEEKNIEACLKSIQGFAERVIVVDSGSTDATAEIVKRYGGEVYEHPFEYHAKQFNWALDNIPIRTRWTLRLDADERFTPELCARLEKEMTAHANDDVNGFTLAARLWFMDKCFKYGGSKKRKLMVFKTGFGRIEDRRMDEHTLLLSGTSMSLPEKYEHYDFKDLNTFVKKLNWYATKEMQDYMSGAFPDERFNAADGKIGSIRAKKTKYYRLPMFLRCWLYFLYAYFLKGNFLNGKEGFIYSFLFYLYYRILVDAKIWEQKKYNRPFEKNEALK